MTTTNALLVFAGGGLGAVCRYIITTYVGARFVAFPMGTLAVNAAGSFLMGLIMGLLLLATERYGLIAEPYRLLLTVGFLGGLTTFSSFSFETLLLLKGGSYFPALFSVAANVVLGLLLAGGGFLLTRGLLR